MNLKELERSSSQLASLYDYRVYSIMQLSTSRNVSTSFNNCMFQNTFSFMLYNHRTKLVVKPLPKKKTSCQAEKSSKIQSSIAALHYVQIATVKLVNRPLYLNTVVLDLYLKTCLNFDQIEQSFFIPDFSVNFPTFF